MKKEICVPIKGWKAVHKDLSSCCEWGKGEVFYSTHRFVEPNEGCGPLTVFNSLKSVKLFTSHLQMPTIYSCLYYPSKEKEVWTPGSKKLSTLKLWEGNKSCIIPGSVKLASRVKLIEEI